MRLLVTFFLFVLSIAPVCSQRGMLEYAVGVRVGTGNGFSLQYFHTDAHVVEGIITMDRQGYTLCGLYEQHHQILDIHGLKWYGGVGLHASAYPSELRQPLASEYPGSSRFVGGLDGILGIEYFFGSIPLQCSIDWKPQYHTLGWVGWGLDTGAISVRWRL